MNIFKKFLSAKTVLLLAVMMVGMIISSACSKDDKSGQPDDPTSTNELVGTWYFTYDGETDYDDYFVFKSNGRGYYNYDDETDDFTYTYNSKSEILTLNYEDGETVKLSIEWLGNNKIDFDDYGIYVRK